MNTRTPIPADIRVMNHLATAIVVLFVVVLAAGLLVRAFAKVSVFDVRAIEITSPVVHTNAVTLRAHVAPRMSGSFFTADLVRIKTAFETVPWVRQAVVHRAFPNRLRVELQEHVPVAYWGHDAQPQLVNSFGEVFEANVGEIEQEQLPRFNGPVSHSAEVLAMYRAIAPQFAEMEWPIAQLDLSERGSWRVQMESGALIELGRGNLDEVAQRTQRFLKTLTQVVSRYGRPVQAVEFADLRHQNGYAVRVQGVSTVAPEAPAL